MERLAAVALIFDLDGTIWDSAGWFAAALENDQRAVEELRQDLIAGGNIVGVLRTTGVTRERMLRRAVERRGPPPLFEGIGEMLAELQSKEIPLAVATSLPGTIANPMLELAGLSNVFKAVVHAGLCRVPKPSPASLIMALRMIEQRPSKDVYYVGDRASDALAASRAGVNFAWLRHGYEQPDAAARIATYSPRHLVSL